MTREHHAVHCSVEECELQNENGNYVPGVEVTCPKCGHVTQSFGTSERSIKRCLVLMREECPMRERNYYVADEQESLEEFERRDPAPAAGHEHEVNSLMSDQEDIPF